MKTLKDYTPSEFPPAKDIVGNPPPAARPYENTVGESSGGVFDQRGTGRIDEPVVSSSVELPWTPTPNGDEFININFGSTLALGDGNATLAETHYYEGGSIEVTAATGVIYGLVPIGMSFTAIVNLPYDLGDGYTFDVTLMRLFPDSGSPLTVHFAETLPTYAPASATGFVFEIAKVALEDGVASVTRRVLYANPILNDFLEPPG